MRVRNDSLRRAPVYPSLRALTHSKSYSVNARSNPDGLRCIVFEHANSNGLISSNPRQLLETFSQAGGQGRPPLRDAKASGKGRPPLRNDKLLTFFVMICCIAHRRIHNFSASPTGLLRALTSKRSLVCLLNRRSSISLRR